MGKRSKNEIELLVGATGLLSGFWTEFCRQVEASGGNAHDIYRLVTPAGQRTITEMAELAVHHAQEDAINAFSRGDYKDDGQPPVDRTADTQDDELCEPQYSLYAEMQADVSPTEADHGKIRRLRFPVSPDVLRGHMRDMDRPVRVEFAMLEFSGRVALEYVYQVMQENGYRNAQLEHLIVFAREFWHYANKKNLVALKTTSQEGLGDERVAFFGHTGDAEFGIRSMPLFEVWPEEWRFLGYKVIGPVL